MKSLITDIIKLLTNEQKKSLVHIQLLVVISAIFEIFGISMIGFFMSVISQPETIKSNFLTNTIQALFSPKDSSIFIITLGILTLAILATSSLLSTFTLYNVSRFSSFTGAKLGDRLFSYYLNQSWLFHTKNSSTYLIKQIATEAARSTTAVIYPLLLLNSKLVLALCISIGVFIFDPIIAMGGLSIFLVAYSLIFFFVKPILTKNGEEISHAMAARYSILSEGFNGVREIMLSMTEDQVSNEFAEQGHKFARAQSNNQLLSQAPRYIMELIALSTIILLVIFLSYKHENNLSELLPILAIYGVAGLKLLPALQAIYAYLAQIRGNLHSFNSIKNDLISSNSSEYQSKKNTNDKMMTIQHEIKLENVSFRYPGSKKDVLKKLSISFPANQSIGIVGSSGSGKSTAIDLLLGFITPDNGNILIDDTKLNDSNLSNWRKSLGYVPQKIFLKDQSIVENIAFGTHTDNIDMQRAMIAAERAQLVELINELPEGINTIVGEQGIQLSGGQRQRIGIARALYHDSSILILDEATSALDAITESKIIDSINALDNKTIIMIAHRISTLAGCDKILIIDKGEVSAEGKYADLIKNNEEFQKLAKVPVNEDI